MFTENSLRQYPAVIRAFMGLPAATFWELIEKITEHLPAYETQRLERADRQRRVGGGRDFDQPPRAYSVEGRTPEHRPREAQRAACRSAAVRRAVASRWWPPARSLRGRSGL